MILKTAETMTPPVLASTYSGALCHEHNIDRGAVALVAGYSTINVLERVTKADPTTIDNNNNRINQ